EIAAPPAVLRGEIAAPPAVLRGGEAAVELRVVNAGMNTARYAQVDLELPALASGVRLLEVIASEGAVSRLAPSAMSAPLIDFVDIPAGGEIVYRLSFDLDLTGMPYRMNDAVASATGRVSPASYLLELAPADNAAVVNWRVIESGVAGGVDFTAVAGAFVNGEMADVALADVNADGFLDLIAVHPAEGVFFYLNDGQGSFGAPSQSHDILGGTAVAAINYDGDGDIEIAVATETNHLYLLSNVNRASFARLELLASPEGTHDVDVGDFDGDALPDLLVTAANGDFTILWNQPLNPFTIATIVPGEGRYLGATIGDVDGDGDFDFVAHSVDGFGDRVYVNDDGVLTPAFELPADSQTADGALFDVEGDGDLDWIAAKIDAPNRLWLNLGDGQFVASPQQLGETSGAVEAGDLDGDGDVDLYLASASGDENWWYRNDAGEFVRGAEAIGAGVSFGAALGDLNRDGKVDIVTADGLHPNGRVWLNSNAPGDFDHSGVVDGADLGWWEARFGLPDAQAPNMPKNDGQGFLAWQRNFTSAQPSELALNVRLSAVDAAMAMLAGRTSSAKRSGWRIGPPARER
ncbi:MAG: VCBS repeat-containing protein, partial [Planctomycetales bacterium]|nr:VCBS repeat-containing protein [Planctomycetales bacterium]